MKIRPWRKWSLRARMVLVTAAFAGIALIVADLAGVVLLRSYLIDRVDAQLQAQAQRPSPTRGPRPDNRPHLGEGSSRVVRAYQFYADGTPVQSSDDIDPVLGSFTAVRAHADGGPYTTTGPGGSWRVLVTRQAVGGGYLVSAVSLHDIEETQGLLLVVDAAVTGLVLLLLGSASASVIRIGLRPLTRMEDTADQIAGGDLTRRVSDADPHTESGRLGTALNTMLTRIEAAVADQTASERRLRQFLADASHELRTPLTSIQGFAELYRRGGTPPGPELDEAMGSIESEVGRMRLLVNDLLLLARLDEERPLDRRPVDLLAVAADAVRDAHVRVPGRFVELTGLDADAETFEPVTVPGDEPRLRQVAINLLANALQHTPEGTSVAVRVGRLVATNGAHPAAAVGDLPSDGAPVAVLEVADTGPGIGEPEARRVFERLYRADPSRSRSHGGAGLGLAIVAAIVQAHGGRVELWTTAGAGARFRVLLPADPPES
jgi:two-component system OmpR family sensor kinase